MGTKANPGAFDCHAAAEPDEPLFTLLARDPSAALFVQTWALVRAGAYNQARTVFNALIEDAHHREKQPDDADKAAEASACALAMQEWHKDHR